MSFSRPEKCPISKKDPPELPLDTKEQLRWKDILLLNQGRTHHYNMSVLKNVFTVRPRDTRPQAARTLQVHVFELGPKIFELNEFM